MNCSATNGCTISSTLLLLGFLVLAIAYSASNDCSNASTY